MQAVALPGVKRCAREVRSGCADERRGDGEIQQRERDVDGHVLGDAAVETLLMKRNVKLRGFERRGPNMHAECIRRN